MMWSSDKNQLRSSNCEKETINHRSQWRIFINHFHISTLLAERKAIKFCFWSSCGEQSSNNFHGTFLSIQPNDKSSFLVNEELLHRKLEKLGGKLCVMYIWWCSLVPLQAEDRKSINWFLIPVWCRQKVRFLFPPSILLIFLFRFPLTTSGYYVHKFPSRFVATLGDARCRRSST